jgi:hypothetical protein
MGKRFNEALTIMFVDVDSVSEIIAIRKDNIH